MLFDRPLDSAALDGRTAGFPAGQPRLALMPGSRPDELARNFPVLLGAFRRLKDRWPKASGLIAATSPAVEIVLRDMAERDGGWPDGLGIVVADTDAVIHWCDLALVKSGTVTLQVTRHGRPMVIFYKKSNPLFFVFARIILSTSLFSLPNLLARRRIVPELIPHFGGPGPIASAARRLLESPERMQAQQRELAKVREMFQGLHAARAAAATISEIVG
jgi:lipid-A-disaccharide synthase